VEMQTNTLAYYSVATVRCPAFTTQSNISGTPLKLEHLT
jgi:hypothetical protein